MTSLYFIAILPPEELSEQIDDIRKECAERFQVKAGLKPPVHITLYRPFHLEQELENHLIKSLSTVTYSHSPFEQQLENFDSFNAHTLYIRAIKNPKLAALQKNITSVILRHKLDVREVKGNTLFTPHVTIAYRDIPPETFPLIWETFKDKKFKRSFMTERFALLKHDGKKWNVLKNYGLKYQPASTLF